MKGDFSRKSFRKEKHYRKVNMQQGRVQLDADWNEQGDIQLHHSSRALEDIIGKSGVPFGSQKCGFAGFKIVPGRGNNYTIKKGHYYVDGILCENEADVEASKQPDLPLGRTLALPNKKGTYLVYLDVWERHLTGLDDPEILEPALGGPDTATRTKIVWQVKIKDIKLPSKHEGNCRKLLCPFHSIPESGRMRARSRKVEPSDNGCIMAPEAGYRGLENQLYRVEIHEEGTVGTDKPPTFKWSRDNGSVVAKVKRFLDETMVIPSKGIDHELGFSSGHWVEVIDDRHELWGIPGTFVKLIDVKEVGDDNETELKFDLSSINGDPLTEENFPEEFKPKVRRWDMRDGPIKVTIPTKNGGYIELEDGVEVRFESARSYRTGDYWLIPARSATSDIIWPQGMDGPEPLPPEGIQHHFSSLALLNYNGIQIEVISDCRKFFPATTNLPLIYYIGGNGQEASPGNEIAFPLKVGVAIDPRQTSGLKVRFIIENGEGKVLVMGVEERTDYLDVEIENQVVECHWKLGNNGPQQVKAVLLNKDDAQIGLPLYFNARTRTWDDSLEATRPKLAELAQQIVPKATIKDLVLPKREKELLREIAIHVAHQHRVYKEWGFEASSSRGLGISALFVGPSGTGKTMAAEVLANELRLSLFRIDLSTIVNKYIGETEKNLRKVFDAAENDGAILFFDEADALFGKRSEVGDSHDRYANIEIGYLLQLMEDFKGLAILATNMKNSLDPDFMRRIRFIVNFPFPNEKSRLKIWQQIFPPNVPRENLDYNRLARLNLTGGEIRNIALRAAFLAANEKVPVNMNHLKCAAHAEYIRLRRPFNSVE